jgi:hypothetical protein
MTMYAVLAGKMDVAVKAAHFPSNPTAGIVWGFTLREILQVLMDEAIELGGKHREDIQQAARSAVDTVVNFDLPLIPEGVENTLDEATRAARYAAIDAVLNAILGPAD